MLREGRRKWNPNQKLRIKERRRARRRKKKSNGGGPEDRTPRFKKRGSVEQPRRKDPRLREEKGKVDGASPAEKFAERRCPNEKVTGFPACLAGRKKSHQGGRRTRLVRGDILSPTLSGGRGRCRRGKYLQVTERKKERVPFQLLNLVLTAPSDEGPEPKMAKPLHLSDKKKERSF